VSSADGWLVEGESPKQAPGLCREKRRPKAGEGRAYTQNPATAQASDLTRRLAVSGRAGGSEFRRARTPVEGGRTGRRCASRARPALDRPRVEL